MIDVHFMKNESPVEKIGKYLVSGSVLSCALKDNTSILDPVLIVRSSDTFYTYNYMHIPEFHRYYFIDDIRSVHNIEWEIHGHIDVLETYKNEILSNTAVIRRQENKFNLYLDDPEFKTYNTEQIQTIKFPANDFSKSLHYILTVNGSYGAGGE